MIPLARERSLPRRACALPAGDGFCDPPCASSEACSFDCNDAGACDCGSSGGGGSTGGGGFGTGGFDPYGPGGFDGGYYGPPTGPAFSAACQAKGCLSQWRGDGVCDPNCNNEECGFDCGTQPGSFYACDCFDPYSYGALSGGSGAPAFDPYASFEVASVDTATGQTLGPLSNALDQGLLNKFGGEVHHEVRVGCAGAALVVARGGGANNVVDTWTLFRVHQTCACQTPPLTCVYALAMPPRLCRRRTPCH